MSTSDARRERLHHLVIVAMAKGAERVPAMVAVADAEGVRPGIVAAAFWRVTRQQVEREGAIGRRQVVPAGDTAGQQMTLDATP